MTAPIPARADAGAAPLRLDVVADPATVAAAWREIEAEGAVPPFQSFAWCEAWFAAAATKRGSRPLILRGRRGEATVLLLPLIVDRIGPLAVARRLGGSHASYVVGAWRPAALAATDPAELGAALSAVAAAEGVDAVVLTAVPVEWAGGPNPLAALGAATPSLDDGHAFRLEADFDRLLAARNAGHKRKKLKTKERLLEAAGGYRIATATTPAEVEATLAAFYAQKAASLAARGIADPFADPAVRAALARLARPSATTPPVLELTRLEAGGAIRAVIGAMVGGDRLYALFASHALDDLARASPGETLFHRHIEASCRRGLAVYDMGVGSERYKASWCDERLALVDVRLAVTLRGRLFLAVAGLRDRLVARIRRDERLWPVVKHLRARLAGRRGDDTGGEAG